MLPRKAIGAFLVLACVAGFGACAKTYQAGGSGKAEPSGFLSDYSILREGAEGEAMLVYRIEDKAKWATYRKIMIPRVQVWKSIERGMEMQDAQYLSSNLWSQLDAELRKDYQITTQPGPGVLRFEVAITEAGKSRPILDLVTTVQPIGRAGSEAKRMAAGTESFVGVASVEARITDSLSGELLAAAVDRRGGGKYATKGFARWADVEEAFAFWAKQARWRLCLQRGGENCQKPEA